MTIVNSMAEKSNYDTAGQVQFMKEISEHFGCNVVTKRQINEYVKLKGLAYPRFIFSKKYEESFGKYRVAADLLNTDHNSLTKEVHVLSTEATNVTSISQERVFSRKLAANITENLVPEKDKTYVPFGFYNDLKSIIKSKIFYPIYITGLSGNGKTVMVEQICAAIDRELVRVNITKETDETDLIGSYELIDGNTVRREGPVITAMRKGAILLLDETDYGSERLLCLQPILEGKPYLDKKTGEMISPAEGFNIIATANTKGKGSEDGRFIGANVLNEAFLERFAITVEQEYPSPDVERQILNRNFTVLNISDPTFIENLVSWAEIVRKNYNEGNTDEIISTRRLVHIAKAFSIFKNRMKAIELCLNRFDDDTKVTFLDLYEKVDGGEPENKVHFTSADAEAIKANVGGQSVGTTAQPSAPSSAAPAASSFKNAATSGNTPNPSSSSIKNVAATNLPAFATMENLVAATQKYSEKVKLGFDESTKDWIVESHGCQTRVSVSALSSGKEQKKGEWLDLLVMANMNKKAGSLKMDYRPIN